MGRVREVWDRCLLGTCNFFKTNTLCGFGEGGRGGGFTQCSKRRIFRLTIQRK